MAHIGLKYMICAPITETNTAVSYKDGIVMSNAISAEISINLSEANLSADDRIVESIKEFREGSLNLNGDHLSYSTLALILGHMVEKLTDGSEILVAKGDDDGQFVGVGFYATSIKNGVRKFRAIWLRKVKFGIPNENLQTKGGTGISFQTPTVSGTILTDVTNKWKEEGLFLTEDEARAWLQDKADIQEDDIDVLADIYSAMPDSVPDVVSEADGPAVDVHADVASPANHADTVSAAIHDDIASAALHEDNTPSGMDSKSKKKNKGDSE